MRSFRKVCAAGLLLICTLSVVVGIGFAATPTPGPKSTFTPTPTPTPTRAVLTALKRQLSFLGGGGSGPICDPTLTDDGFPALDYKIYHLSTSIDVVCLYRFQEGEKVTVNIYDPNNRLVASIPVMIKNDPHWEEYDYQIYMMYLPKLPMTAPAGKWKVVAKSSHLSATNWFIHPGNAPDYALSKAVPPGASWFDPRRNTTFAAGSTLMVDGVNYPKNKDIPVAVYSRDDNLHIDLDLVTAQLVHTDNSGSFAAGFAITDQFKQGLYYVLIDPNLLIDPNIRNKSNALSYYFYVVQPEQVCPGALSTYFKKGMSAMVNPGPPNNVREQPGLKNRLLGRLYDYETITITAGPKCADGMVWWKVISSNTGLDGWTPEGQANQRFIEPYN